MVQNYLYFCLIYIFFTLYKAPIIFIWDLSSSGPSLIWALRQSPTLPWAGCQIDVAWASPPSSNAGRALPRGAWHASARPSCRPSASCSPPPPPTLAARRSFPWNALHPTCDKNPSNLTLKQGSRENLKTIESIIRETFPRITVFLLVWLTPTRLDTACKRMKFSKVFFSHSQKVTNWQKNCQRIFPNKNPFFQTLQSSHPNLTFQGFLLGISRIIEGLDRLQLPCKHSDSLQERPVLYSHQTCFSHWGQFLHKIESNMTDNRH